MATKLEISTQKLARLEKEYEEAVQSACKHMGQTNGQPMNDKRNGQAFFNKRDQLESRIFNKMHEIEAQKERISSLKEREFKKENHLTANYGLQTSVHNIEKFKERKQDKKTREKIKALEQVAAKAEKDTEIISESAKKLIESGKVSQWEKLPIYYFVNGLKKVALVINNKSGDFMVSGKYPAKNEKEKQFIEELLNVNSEERNETK